MEKTWRTDLVSYWRACGYTRRLFFCTSDTHAFESLIRWLFPFSKPVWCMNLRSWLCEASGAWISFSCGWQPTEIRTVDRHCKTRSDVSTNERLTASIAKLHQKVPVGLPGLSSLSPTWYMFFRLTGGGGSSDDLFQMVFLLFSSRDNAKQQIKCFVCSFYSGFFRAELRYPVLWCSSYLCLKPGSRLLQILIFISLLFTITIVCSCLRKKFVSRFHRTGKLILGYWLVLFLRCCDLASFGFHEHLANFFSFRMHAPTRMKYSFTLPKTSSWVPGPLKMGRFTPQKGR